MVLGPFKQCQKTQGKKKGLVTIVKVSVDVVELWNELTNGSESSNSLTKANVAFIVQKTRHNKKITNKGF
jgi:hypothetical protein